jgi:hypothetical protein
MKPRPQKPISSIAQVKFLGERRFSGRKKPLGDNDQKQDPAKSSDSDGS